MLQKEDLGHQSDQPVSNSPKWIKKLTLILTSVLLLSVFGIGGYWLGAGQQQSIPTGILTNQSLTATPVQQLQSSQSKGTVDSDKFDLQRILKLVSFYDLKRTKKFLVHYITDKNQGGYSSVFIADTTLDLNSAVKIVDMDFQDIGNSPFVSYGSERKYIAIELEGTDTKDLAIADENGKLITKNVLETNNFKFKELTRGHLNTRSLSHGHDRLYKSASKPCSGSVSETAGKFSWACPSGVPRWLASTNSSDTRNTNIRSSVP
jgi:hypothetical protein